MKPTSVGQPGGWEKEALERGIAGLAERIRLEPRLYVAQADALARFFFVSHKDMWYRTPIGDEILAPSTVAELQSAGVSPEFINRLHSYGLLKVLGSGRKLRVLVYPSTFDALEEAFRRAGVPSPLPPREERERIIREALAFWQAPAAPQPAPQAPPQPQPAAAPAPPAQPAPQDLGQLSGRLDRLERRVEELGRDLSALRLCLGQCAPSPCMTACLSGQYSPGPTVSKG